MDERKVAGSSGKANSDILRGNLPTEIRNSYWNHAAIVSMLISGQAQDLINAPRVRAKPLLILASGPSLDEAFPTLKDWEGDLMCTQSHAVTCLGWGKAPTYVVAYDVRSRWEHFSPHPEGGFDRTTLITHPGIDKSVLPMWPADVYLFQNLSIHTSYYAEEQTYGYSWPKDDTQMIRTQLRPFASSVSAMVSIGNMMGYNPMFLVGADFGYPGGKERFTRRTYDAGSWVDTDPGLADGKEEIEGCPTDRIQGFYKRALVQAWRLDKSPLINCSKNGSLGKLMPRAGVVDVIAKQGKGFKPLTWKECILRADQYLSEQNHYAIETEDGGLFFIEQASLDDLEKSMGVMRKRGVPVDVEKNMRRLRRLVKRKVIIKTGSQGKSTTMRRDD